ncbi:hypothetical protein [Sulfurimonas sp.]|uniref:hypothetical protein n=1 Tax=Sulfurimonas sp. TaxID=2022749 RepID=UPI002AB323AF|nr:hypothetical protein [Sulfurimonas sp.]
MLFNKINFSEIILNQYIQSWFIWIGLFIVGVLLLKYAHFIGTTNREINKMESSGAGLVSLSVVIHFGVIWALI